MESFEFDAKISRGPNGHPVVRIPMKYVRTIGDEWVLESLSMKMGPGNIYGCDMWKCRITRSGTSRYVSLNCDRSLIGREAHFEASYGVERCPTTHGRPPSMTNGRNADSSGYAGQ